MANDGTSGRRKQTDFQGLTFDNWKKTGAQDAAPRAKRGDLNIDKSANEAATGAKGFEGSFITIESPGMKRKADLGTDIV